MAKLTPPPVTTFVPFDYTTAPIKTVFCHIGVHLCQYCDTTWSSKDGYTFKIVKDGVLLKSPDEPKYNMQPGCYVLITWNNLHGVQYAPPVS